MTDWILKSKAILHDPLDKQYIMWKGRKNHLEVARSLINKWLPQESIEDENVKKADILASAISRIIVAPEQKKEIFEKEVNEFFSKNKNLSQIIYIDVFSQKQETVNLDIDHKEVEEFFEKIDKILNQKTFNSPNERAKDAFLLIWRFLPEVFKDWIFTHPADTRAPNHSVYDHLVQTSAIASSLPKPAFLLFNIGPVQDFIATSRKTQDLWAGSFLVSYLCWKAIEALIGEYGPDCIVYPNLLKQPLCDRWLKEKFKEFNLGDWQKYLDDNITSERFSIANLPNRFLAIIPEDREIAQRCENAVKNAFKEIADQVWEEIENRVSLEEKEKVKERFDEQIKQFFEIYWTVLPWTLSQNINAIDDILDEYKNLIGETETYKTIDLIKQHPWYKPVSVGTAYSLLVELNEKFLGARKSIRSFSYTPQEGRYRCSLCGVRSELSGKRDAKSVDKFWKGLKLPVGLLREGERLCAVCLVKRLAPRCYFKHICGEDLSSFPSTAEMASIPTKIEMDKEKAEKFKKQYEEKFKKFEKDLPKSSSVPLLKTHLLYEIDGQWLMEESYRKEYLEREYGIKEIAEKDLEQVRRFLRENNISPEKYYAVLLMDGDDMGKWLKGEKFPLIKDLIHPFVRYKLLAYGRNKEKTELEALLCKPHPMSASFHQAFSRKLSKFAVEKVRSIVENHYGKLIYCGGDDVLAFLPKDTVLECAKNIQAVFKEIISPSASMSAGIVIAHYKCPLKVVLDEVRDAERRAKNEYGKDSFCVKVLMHSGEWWHTGSKWYLENIDLVEFMKNFVCKFRCKEIPSQFPYHFLHTALVISKDGQQNARVGEVLKRELKRIYERKVEDKEFLGNLLTLFDHYKSSIRQPFERFARFILLARFIAKAEGK